MRGALEDLKHALRIYRRTPGASLVAVVVLAIGLAAVTAFVSLYVDLILRPHPGFERGSRIVTFGWTDGQRSGNLQLQLIERIAAESATLESVAGVSTQPFAIGQERKNAVGEVVTREFFSGIRPRLAIGRGFEPEEHEMEGEPVAVISYRHWQEAFDGREDVLGKTIGIDSRNRLPVIVNGQAQAPDERPLTDFRIVGVMAPEYTGMLPGQSPAVFWIPVEQAIRLNAAAVAAEQMRSRFSLRGIGQRKRGASAAAVTSELNARYLADMPTVFGAGPGMRIEALDGLVSNMATQRSAQRQLQLFLGASVLLALVAAANVSLFLLARAPGRRRELGIRMAVGAPLERIARQLASEASLLVIAGGVLGLVGSVWLAEFLRGLTFLRQAQWRDVTLLDWRVLAIVGAFLALLALLVSLAPILGLKRLGIAASSRQISARPSVAQRVAGTVQLAIAGTLGGAALAFTWYLGSLVLGYPGYETRNIHAVTFSVARTADFLSTEEFEAAIESSMREQSRLREAVAGLPGVRKVSIAGSAPGVSAAMMGTVVPDPNDPTRQLNIQVVPIDEHYVDVLKLTLLHGRSVGPGEPAAVLVNRTLARAFFGRDDVGGENLPFSAFINQRSEIVGVLDDLSYQHPMAGVQPTVFATALSAIIGGQLALIESTLSSAALRQALQKLVDSGVVEMSIIGVTPLTEARSTLLAADRARSFLTIGTAALVVVLAGFGFYGTQRYLVAAGRREYAIRASLGAGPRALGALVFRRGFALGLPGLVLALPSAFIVVAWLRDEYVSRDVSPALVTLAVALGVATLLAAASIGPARHARATQPAPLLRQD